MEEYCSMILDSWLKREMENQDFDMWSDLMYYEEPLSMWCEENPPLMDVYTAASIGDFELIAEAIKRGYAIKKLSKQNRSGWTPLMYACCGQHEDIVKLFVNTGLDVNCRGYEGLTPLMIAAKGPGDNLLQLLLEKLGYPCTNILEATDKRGWTALIHAVKMGQEDSVKCLLHYGANVNAIEVSKGHSVLMLAAESTQVTLVQTLLKAGADYTMISHLGETALSIALKCGNEPVARLLQPSILVAKEGQPKDLYTLLQSLGLEKYWPHFRDKDVDLQVFLTLSEVDLKKLGINLLGPRKKMAIAIAQWHAEF